MRGDGWSFHKENALVLTGSDYFYIAFKAFSNSGFVYTEKLRDNFQPFFSSLNYALAFKLAVFADGSWDNCLWLFFYALRGDCEPVACKFSRGGFCVHAISKWADVQKSAKMCRKPDCSKSCFSCSSPYRFNVVNQMYIYSVSPWISLCSLLWFSLNLGKFTIVACL